MFYMSFCSHIGHRNEAADGNLAQAPLTIVIGALWVITIVGFLLSLESPQEPPR